MLDFYKSNTASVASYSSFAPLRTYPEANITSTRSSYNEAAHIVEKIQAKMDRRSNSFYGLGRQLGFILGTVDDNDEYTDYDLSDDNSEEYDDITSLLDLDQGISSQASSNLSIFSQLKSYAESSICSLVNIASSIKGSIYSLISNYTLATSRDISPTQFENVIARLGFDIGSGSVKVKGVIISDDCQTMVYSRNIPLKFRADLDISDANTFSEEIQEKSVNLLAEAQAEFQLKIPSDIPIQSCGVATAAFRSANNGYETAMLISAKLNFPIDILSQHEEGIIAYQGALNNARSIGLKLKQPIIWDIGGGSMQFSYYDTKEGTFTVCGSEVASETVFKLIVDTMDSTTSVFGADFSNEEIENAIALIKSRFPKYRTECENILTRIADGSDVLAVGAFHNLGMQAFVQGVLGKENKEYSKQDILDVINRLNMVTPEKLKEYLYVPDEFIANQLSDLFLTLATMEKMGIDTVHTVQINNADGIMFSGCPWRSNVRQVVSDKDSEALELRQRFSEMKIG